MSGVLLFVLVVVLFVFFFFQAEDGIRDRDVTGVQTCALPIFPLEETLPRGSLFKERDVRGYGLQRHAGNARQKVARVRGRRSEERRVGKECRSGWSRDH